MTTLSIAGQEAIGECFLLVNNNGKVYVNGRRSSYPLASSRDTLLTQLQATAHQLLTTMYRASLKRGTQLAPKVDLKPGLIPVEPSDLALHCQDAAHLPYLRWMAIKAVSPTLRKLLATVLTHQRKN